uniref:Uncharacterized protein n=1 Tax=Arundo donax TaxID=35708 RepID=A0A0A9CZQ3_ARUDO
MVSHVMLESTIQISISVKVRKSCKPKTKQCRANQHPKVHSCLQKVSIYKKVSIESRPSCSLVLPNSVMAPYLYISRSVIFLKSNLLPPTHARPNLEVD